MYRDNPDEMPKKIDVHPVDICVWFDAQKLVIGDEIAYIQAEMKREIAAPEQKKNKEELYYGKVVGFIPGLHHVIAESEDGFHYGVFNGNYRTDIEFIVKKVSE